MLIDKYCDENIESNYHSFGTRFRSRFFHCPTRVSVMS